MTLRSELPIGTGCSLAGSVFAGHCALMLERFEWSWIGADPDQRELLIDVRGKPQRPPSAEVTETDEKVLILVTAHRLPGPVPAIVVNRRLKVVLGAPLAGRELHDVAAGEVRILQFLPARPPMPPGFPGREPPVVFTGERVQPALPRRMHAGNPGEDPITDILWYRLPVFGAEADRLVEEINALGGLEEIAGDCRAELWRMNQAADRNASHELVAKLQQVRLRIKSEAMGEGLT